MDDAIHFVVAADEAFWPQLNVVVASIVATHSAEQVSVTILSPDGRVPRDLPQSESVSVRAFDLRHSSLDLQNAALQHAPHATSTSLARLALSEALPPHTRRAIYLDADTLVRHNLRDLHRIDLGGQVVAAVHDPVIPFVGVPGALDWEHLGLDPWTPYFNSGVMVVDVAKWQSSEISARAVEALTHERCNWGDQCALNIVLAGSWQPISCTWNLQAGHLFDSLAWMIPSELAGLGTARRDPAVVHFNTSRLGRPWHATCHHPFQDEWWQTLKSTPFRSWQRPTPTVRERLLGYARQVATNVLKP